MARMKPSYTFSELPVSRQGIERQTGRILSMRTAAPLAKLRMHINQQKASPFFKLPAEIRNDVYELVFAEYTIGQYPPTAKWMRSGYEGQKNTDCALLLTCRQVWIEAYNIPISLATPTFWFWNGPRDLARMELSHAAPEDKIDETTTICTSETQYFQQFFKNLTPINRTNIQNVQIFASEAWLDSLNGVESYFSKLWFSTKILTITIRKFDWSRGARGINIGWLKEILSSPLFANVQVLRLELEWTHDQELDTLATAIASITCKNFTCNGYTVEISSEDYVAVATITWTSSALVSLVQKHAKGYAVRDRRVETFVGVPVRGKPQKRGGRRSQAVWYRNHWQPDFSGPEGKKALREGKAAALTEKWLEEGSLLCLV